MSVKVTANSLSRSTNFNLFVIFLDALIMVVYDVKRSKFVMLTKSRNDGWSRWMNHVKYFWTGYGNASGVCSCSIHYMGDRLYLFLLGLSF